MTSGLPPTLAPEQGDTPRISLQRGQGGIDGLDPRDEPIVQQVFAQLHDVGRLGVAFSGGVDSSVLLALAVRALGTDQVLAILGVSSSLAASERSAALNVAATIGAELIELQTHEDQREEYLRNGPDRCFHCRDELFTRISDDLVQTHLLDAVAYGENADDTNRLDRPGARAATVHRVLRPLADAGMDKASVRRVAHVLGLPSAQKPAAPCLASRIPHFERVEPAKLRQIEQAEDALHQLGFAEVRVRHHGDIARIELSGDDLARAASTELRTEISTAVRAAGFRFVTLDLSGMQSGAFTLPLLTTSHD